MFLSKLDIYDFRQFIKKESGEPGLTVLFNEKFNILIGENDSGKSTIIDALKYLFGTLSDDYERLNEDDFFYDGVNFANRIEIVGEFRSLSPEESGAFLEWLSFDPLGEATLRVSMIAEKKFNHAGQEYIDRKIKAGDKRYEATLSSNARSLLKATYLKPLRDAKQELHPGYKSRLAQILKAHPSFKTHGEGHKLVELVTDANKEVEEFFSQNYVEDHSLTGDLELILKNFYDTQDEGKAKSNFTIANTNLSAILKRLSLDSDQLNLGLGNQNLLFIATEFLLLNDYVNLDIKLGPNLVLIEEIEAHIHTQAQIRLIKFLQEELEENSTGQFILTTHSNEIVSAVNPEYLILMNDQSAFPLSIRYSDLSQDDMEFLKRFFDSTKSNALFAKGLILVEGDSENLLIPTLAEFIGYSLHNYGVSIINVRGTSFERYIRMFSRNEKWQCLMGSKFIKMPISIITDIDIKPFIYYQEEDQSHYFYSITKEDADNMMLKRLSEITGQDIELFILDNVGIEYSTPKKLCNDLRIEYTEDNLQQIKEIVQKEYSEKYIQAQKKNKAQATNCKYECYNTDLKVEIAPEWTLEYSLALSCLSKLLFEAIHELRYKDPYKGVKKEAFDEMIDAIDNSKILDNEDYVAYQIFKPINDKIVSKAELSQLLGYKLNNLKGAQRDELVKKIVEDEHIKYLISAIKHSCGISGEEV